VPPCLIFEDDHLLVVNKPAGLNTHAPSPYANEGLYEWLRHREPRWSSLAIIHRLDKDTSGVMLFSKTALANRSLTEQFAQRKVRKTYLLLTDRAVPRQRLVVKSYLSRAGERYVSSAASGQGELAETEFEPLDWQAALSEQPKLCPESRAPGELRVVRASPLTGRTHQIRVHAAEKGFPILGDTLYGGTSAPRVYLHAAEIRFQHPASGSHVTFTAPADFAAEPRIQLRQCLLEPQDTNAYRLINGAGDHWPRWYVDRLGDYVLSQSEQPLTKSQRQTLEKLRQLCSARSAYHQIATRRTHQEAAAKASPQLVTGEAAPEKFVVRENGVCFELSFNEGYSVGLFLDQRENRRRFLTNHVVAGFELRAGSQADKDNGRRLEVLNTFAYTCGFSVCAAKSGARTTSLDLSKKYLDWGRRNFELNGLAPAEHEFLHGDVFDWLRRLAKKGRKFDVVILDPPTFSQSKISGVFRAERDYGRLVADVLPLLFPGGVLLASTNKADWKPEEFLSTVEKSIVAKASSISQKHYVPQPHDFPASRDEPAYLKTVWIEVR
jgi:23S rRNA (cytosine1962-C5)-methyltransferase